MEILSINKFRKLCIKSAFKNFYFSQDYQPGGDMQDMKLFAEFDKLIVVLNPNRICLKNKFGTLCFGRVKFVIHFDSETQHKDTFGIVCGNFNNDEENITYVIGAF